MRAEANHATQNLLREYLLEFWCSGWHVLYPEGFDPFCRDGVTVFHRHAGIGVKHLGASATAPGEEAEKVVFADGLGPGRGIGVRQAIRHAAFGI